jgi:hypothetical protein
MRTGQIVKPAEFLAPQICLLALSLAAATAAWTPASQNLPAKRRTSRRIFRCGARINDLFIIGPTPPCDKARWNFRAARMRDVNLS